LNTLRDYYFIYYALYDLLGFKAWHQYTH